MATALLLQASLAPGAIDVEVPGDVWYETLIAGQRAGVTRWRVEALGDSTLVTHVSASMSVERFGEGVELQQEDTWRETAAGRPIEYISSRRLAAGERITLVVSFEPHHISELKTVGEREYHLRRDLESMPVFPVALTGLHSDRGFVAGDAYTYTAFDPDFEEVTRCSVVVVGRDTLSLAGERRALNHVRVYSDVYKGMAVDEWRDDNGALWAQEYGSLGIEARRMTADEAGRGFRPPDVAAATIVESNVTIARPELVDEALYEVWLEGGDIEEVLPTGSMQRVEDRTSRGLLLRVSRLDAEIEGEGDDAPESYIEACLEDNGLIQADHPGILAAARAVVPEARTDLRATADAIAGSVARLVENRGYGTAFASAAEVLETGAGDCSEHAVLAAAMARAVGLPSRLATGLVHFRGGFAYHMWIEVWTGDSWYAVDPTRGPGRVDATHILLGTSPLSGGRVGELSLPVLRTANRIRLRVVDYSESGNGVR